MWKEAVVAQFDIIVRMYLEWFRRPRRCYQASLFSAQDLKLRPPQKQAQIVPILPWRSIDDSADGNHDDGGGTSYQTHNKVCFMILFITIFKKNFSCETKYLSACMYSTIKSTAVLRSFGLHVGRGGSDYPGIRTTEGKFRGPGNIQNKSSLNATVKLHKAEILYLIVYNNSKNNNIP
jgi:hypothetical protein